MTGAAAVPGEGNLEGRAARRGEPVAEWASPALDAVLDRVPLTHAEVGSRFPLFAAPDSARWTTTARGSWTGGFWAGLLWLRAGRTGDARDREAAARCTGRLAAWADADTATRGLILWYGTALATGDWGGVNDGGAERDPRAEGDGASGADRHPGHVRASGADRAPVVEGDGASGADRHPGHVRASGADRHPGHVRASGADRHPGHVRASGADRAPVVEGDDASGAVRDSGVDRAPVVEGDDASGAVRDSGVDHAPVVEGERASGADRAPGHVRAPGVPRVPFVDRASYADAHALRARAARACLRDFEPRLGLVPWGAAFGGPRLLARADGVPGMVPLLATEDPEAAVSHLRTHLHLCVRGADGLRPAWQGDTTGRWQPYDDPPPDWTRGRAWLLLALADALLLTPSAGMGAQQAHETLEMLLPRSSDPLVPPARAAHPDGPLDTSAAAITAVALLKLALLRDGRAARYERRARDVLRRLVSAHLVDGRLLDGCYDPVRGTAVRHQLVWGDFFLALGLAALTGLVDLTAV
ncbi:hypothetical protein ACIPPS_14535 [Streptomyces sp. NPDC090127]|uniref:hypothetical protein n=1 Tax=Streptomyces sp. NPDC090127 TaxID=3365953 RepID=UPI003814396A